MAYIGATDHDRPGADVIQVLHVDDDPALVDLSSTFLERECGRIEVSTATDAEAALAHLDAAPVDCIVSDYEMPSMDGLELLDAVRDDHPDLPFILYTGKGSEEIASDAVSAGVTDYIRKAAGTDQYAVLAHRIENAVDQYRSARAVEATEQTLLELAEGTDDLLFMFEGDWSELLFVNSAYEELFGGSIEELRREPFAFAEHIHPDDRDLAIDAVERLQDGDAVDIEYRVQPDGEEVRWVRSLAKPIFDDGEVDRIAGYVRDVTDRRRREDELAAQVTAMDEATDGIAILDEDQTYSYVNQRHAEIYGFDDPEALLGEDWRACYDSEVHERFEDDILHELDERGSWQGSMTVTADDGRTFHQDLTLTRLSDRRVVCVVRDVSDRRESERELERFRILTREASDSIAIVEADGTIVYNNPAIQRILGYEPSTLEAENVFDYIHPEDRERVETAFADLVDGDPGQATRIQYRMRHADGSWRWLESEASSRTDTSLEGYVITSRDVTERKQRTVDLEKYAAVADNMAEAAIIVDEERRLEFANERGLDQVAVEMADLRGKKIERLLGPVIATDEGAERFMSALERVLGADDPEAATESVEVTLELERGSVVADFQLAVVTIDDARKAVVTVRDITDRKRREAALTSLHEITRTLLERADREAVAREAVEATPDVLDHPLSGVWLYDEEADALQPAAVTDAGRELVDEVPTYDRGSGLSWTVYERGEPLLVDDLLEEPDRYNPDTRLRSEIILPLGEYGVLAIGHPEPDRFDELDVALARMFANTVEAALDRADRESRLREKHRELERQNERLDEFASIVSHDLRNPLSVAQGRLELIRDEVEDDHAEAIAHAHERMANLIEDILSLAREESDVVEETAPIDLARLARRSWATVATGDATLAVETDRVVHADKSRLAQLLENLVGNAVEHGGDGVTITVGDLEGGFYVADDGVGIPPEEREKVFEVGYTGSGDGTGFGLRIVEQVAASHGWEVSVGESASGGARFEIRGVEVASEAGVDTAEADPNVESERTS